MGAAGVSAWESEEPLGHTEWLSGSSLSLIFFLQGSYSRFPISKAQGVLDSTMYVS